MIILVVALVLSAIQQNWIEAITIGVIIAVDAIIYYTTFLNRKFLNPSRTALSKPSQSCVTGKNKLSNPLELVPGDIVILREGDRIPADGRIVSESGLALKRIHAYGWSPGYRWDAKVISDAKKVYEQRNMVFAGSFVITGAGKFVVTSLLVIIPNMERIASLASSLGEESPIQTKMNKLVAQIAAIVVVLAIVILIIQLVDGIGILDALEFTLAMIVSAVPEGFAHRNFHYPRPLRKAYGKKNALITGAPGY